MFFCSESVCVTALSECRCVFGRKRLINLKCGGSIVSLWPRISVSQEIKREKTAMVFVLAAGWRNWTALISSPLCSHNPKQICVPSGVSGCWGHHFSLDVVMMMDPRAGHQSSDLQRLLAPPLPCYNSLHNFIRCFFLLFFHFKTELWCIVMTSDSNTMVFDITYYLKVKYVISNAILW